MCFTHKWDSYVPINLSTFLVVAVCAMTVPAYAATLDSQSSSLPVASRVAVDAEAVSPATEREMVASKLQGYGFSEKEARLLLQTMSSEQFRRLASVDTLARSGESGNLVIAVLTAIFLIGIGYKLPDAVRKGVRASDSQPSPEGVSQVKAARWRTDSVSSENPAGPTRSRVQRARRKAKRIPSGDADVPAAARKKPTTRG